MNRLAHLKHEQISIKWPGNRINMLQAAKGAEWGTEETNREEKLT